MWSVTGNLTLCLKVYSWFIIIKDGHAFTQPCAWNFWEIEEGNKKHILVTYSSKVIVKRRWRKLMTIGNILQSFNNYKRFKSRNGFLEVLIIDIKLNRLFRIDKICQSLVIKTFAVQVHLKPYEGESDSILQMCKRSCIQLVIWLIVF